MVTFVTATPGTEVQLTYGLFVVQGAVGDTIQAAAGSVTVFGATSTVSGATGDLIYGGGGSLAFIPGGTAPTIVGGTGPLSLPGASGGTYYGGSDGGNSFALTAATVFGGGPGDQVLGNHDLVVLGRGAETVNDVLTATGSSGGGNTVFGGAGADLIHLGAGGNLVVAGSGPETIFSGSALNVVRGSYAGAPSAVFLGSGTDLLALGPEPTFVQAGSGNSTVFGLEGSFTGSYVSDDLYAVTSGTAGGSLELHGFHPGQDHLLLRGYGANVVADALAGASVVGGSTVLTLPDSTRITLFGLASVGASAFG